jgi:hypothetical protein
LAPELKRSVRSCSINTAILSTDGIIYDMPMFIEDIGLSYGVFVTISRAYAESIVDCSVQPQFHRQFRIFKGVISWLD